MRLAQLIGVSAYGALITIMWLNAGVAAAMLMLTCAVVLITVFRPNDAGEAVTGFARRLLRRRPSGSASS